MEERRAILHSLEGQMREGETSEEKESGVTEAGVVTAQSGLAHTPGKGRREERRLFTPDVARLNGASQIFSRRRIRIGWPHHHQTSLKGGRRIGLDSHQSTARSVWCPVQGTQNTQDTPLDNYYLWRPRGKDSSHDPTESNAFFQQHRGL